jgi:zinc and cadmium transporter
VPDYSWLAEAKTVMPYVLAISASSFIYIATADLIPTLHKRTAATDSLLQTLLLILGIGTIALLHASRDDL